MTKRVTLVALTLVIGVVIAVVGATAAVGLIGRGTFGPSGKALTEADVKRSYASATAAPVSPSSSAPTPETSSPGSSPMPTVLSSGGGTVFALCAAGNVTLIRLIPQGGYRIDGAVTGPARSAWVKFKSAASEVLMTVVCANGKPHEVTAPDDHGGGHGGGHG